MSRLVGGERKRLSINKIFTKDLLIEILHRLPCESAVRCKAVCKRWRSIISSRYFLNRYRSHHKAIYTKRMEKEEFMVDNCSWNYHLFVIPPQYQHQLSFDFIPFFEKRMQKTFIRGHCNGLFLCTADKWRQNIYYICNPITQQFVELPRSRPHSATFNIYVGLACLRRSFRVVRIVQAVKNKTMSEFGVDVFSSQTGQWTHLTVSSPKPLPAFHYQSSGVLYRGFLHWIAGDGFKTIVYDVGRNNIPFIIDRPKEAAPVAAYGPLEGLGLCRGLLFVAQLYNATLRIWQLKYTDKDKKKKQQPEWCLKRRVRLQETVQETILKKSPRVVAIHPYDPNIVYLVINRDVLSCDVLSYDMRTKTLEFVYKSPARGHYSWYHAFSLTLPSWPVSIPQI